MEYSTDEMKTEYAVHIKSNDGKEEHIIGHYKYIDEAIECAERRILYGNRDVYIVTRYITEWRMIVPHRKEM